jgi:hypothetical protein
MMKRCTNFLVGALGFMVGTLGLTTAARSQEYGGDDPRFEWKCVYPYSETNCDRIITRWSNDHGVSPESIMEGTACANCDINYFIDQLGQYRPLFAKCLQRVGARLIQTNTLTPITRFKEGEPSVPGWQVQDWTFATCFDAWECCDYCAMDKDPPYCLIYQEASWGIHVPVQGSVCAFGTAPSIPSEPSTTQPSTTQPSTTQPATSPVTQAPSNNILWYPLN